MFKPDTMVRLDGTYDNPESDSKWDLLKSMTISIIVMAGCLLVFSIMFSLLEPFLGLAWTAAIACAGIGIGIAAFFLIKRPD